MKRTKSIWVVCIFLAGLATANATLQISVSTDKSVYQVGETVQVFVSAYNPTSSTVVMEMRNPFPVTYVMDDAYFWDQNKWLLQVVLPPTSMTIEASETLTWQLDHGVIENTEYFLGIGVHSVKGIVYSDATFGQISNPASFQVIPEPTTVSLLSIGLLLLRKREKI